MRINDFKLEIYFDKYEFTAPLLLCQSDCESMAIEDLLAFEQGAEERFKKSWLGYTEAKGSHELREEIARLYENIPADGILVHVGAQEAIFSYMNVILNPGDHVICMFPIYQSLFEVAAAIGCEVSQWELRQGCAGWELDMDELRQLIKPNTRVIVLNLPNNPTGYLLSVAEMGEIAAIARKHNLHVFSDEVYKGLELDGQKRPWFADIYENAVSLGVMSKAYGLAGLRIGWIATHNREIYDRMVRFKHYLSICSSGPSEFLAALALRHGEVILKRNFSLIQSHLAIADGFFAKYPGLFVNNRPMGGPIAFHHINISQSVKEFCEDLVTQKGVLLLPANMYSFSGNYFRMGYGRKNFATCLSVLEEYIVENQLAQKCEG